MRVPCCLLLLWPQPGGQVLVVRGAHQGSRATLLDINTDKYQARVRRGGGRGASREGQVGAVPVRSFVLARRRCCDCRRRPEAAGPLVTCVRAQIKLLDGAAKGTELWAEYEDVCKLTSA